MADYLALGQIFPIFSHTFAEIEMFLFEKSPAESCARPQNRFQQKKKILKSRLLDCLHKEKPRPEDLLLDELQNSVAKNETRLTSKMHVLDAKMSWMGNTDLRTIVENLHRFSATDPRDLVYAFLGLIAPDSGIGVDYSPNTTLHNVFISVARSLITQDNKLDILEDALARRGEFCFQPPSWVPDWTVVRSGELKLPLDIKQRAIQFWLQPQRSFATRSGSSSAQHLFSYCDSRATIATPWLVRRSFSAAIQVMVSRVSCMVHSLTC